MKQPPLLKVMQGAWRGKSIGRILFNEAISTYSRNLSGRVLDIAGGAHPSYLGNLPKGIDLVRTDLHGGPGVLALDMNAPLPFPDQSFDAILCFNALYIVDDAIALAREVHRVLKRGCAWYVASPFISNEMQEPHDYVRFTAEGLERIFKKSGFSTFEIHRIGERGSAAMGLLNPFCLFNVVRACVYPLALLFDRLVPATVRKAHPSPVGYFCVSVK